MGLDGGLSDKRVAAEAIAVWPLYVLVGHYRTDRCASRSFDCDFCGRIWAEMKICVVCKKCTTRIAVRTAGCRATEPIVDIKWSSWACRADRLHGAIGLCNDVRCGDLQRTPTGRQTAPIAVPRKKKCADDRRYRRASVVVFFWALQFLLVTAPNVQWEKQERREKALLRLGSKGAFLAHISYRAPR